MVLPIAMLVSTGGQAQSVRTKARPLEQAVFGLENEVNRPVNVPEGALQILRTDTEVLRCLKQNQTPNHVSASWFVASEIHLNGPEGIDLVVQPKNTCLFGANIGPFWVFRNTPQGYRMVLTTRALGLEVLRSRTKGYRNIRGVRATATNTVSVLFRFDGHKYRPRNSKVEPIR